MNCTTYNQKLPLYVLDELTSEEKAELEQHLQNCAECQKELSEYRELIEDLSSNDSISVSSQDVSKIKDEVYKSVLQAALQPKRRNHVYKYILQTAAAIIIFFSGYFASAYYTETFQPTNRYTIGDGEYDLTNSFQSYKHSKIGLKLIAKGKKGMNIER